MNKNLHAFGLGIGTLDKDENWLEVFFPNPSTEPSKEMCDVFNDFDSEQIIPKTQLASLAKKLRELDFRTEADLAEKIATGVKPAVAVCLDENSPPRSLPEAYLKLHLLSHRLVKPHGTNLSGLFGILRNVAWTSDGALDPAELNEYMLKARITNKPLTVYSVDKFPQMCDYVVPTGVRIANSARVRLGAYLGEGTTIMHEGFVNFNAGTEGPGMIEGRISAGVTVGSGSDLGGSCSTMGTLSGGGEEIISVGKQCLIGANAGTGIPLGDRCIIEAGLYVTAGTRVTLIDSNGEIGDTVKAKNLSLVSDLLFRRNSTNGAVECLVNRNEILLNTELHDN